MENKQVKIIAGPCSVDENNINDIIDIINLKINNKRVISGVRVVGLKSRTSLNISGKGMGMDYENYMHNLNILINDGNVSQFKDLPSIQIIKELQDKYDILVATEIMDPSIQMPLFKKHLENNKLMFWNPSVNQLGWPLLHMSKYCEKNDWLIGIKNSKNLGTTLEVSKGDNVEIPLEKVWAGLSTYTNLPTEKQILIHRGVNVPDKGDFRNAVVHNVAKKVKLATKCKLYFDPSHSYGPKLRDKIPQAIIDSLAIKIDDKNYLYDGILVEVGKSQTDTEQHITVKELEGALKEVVKFREII